MAPPSNEEVQRVNVHTSTVRECAEREKEMAPPLLSEERVSNVQNLKLADEENLESA